MESARVHDSVGRRRSFCVMLDSIIGALHFYLGVYRSPYGPSKFVG